MMAHTPVLEVIYLRSPLKFCLVGGDARQLSLRSLLSRDGHTVTAVALSDAPADLSPLPSSDCILLPMPLSGTDGDLYAPLCPAALPIPPILDALSSRQVIFGGKIAQNIHAQAAERGLVLRDYLLREELAIANAVPTAEGAVQLAMERLPITIHGAWILIAGFGRVGQCTAQRFKALGANVSICARSCAQLALAENAGCRGIPFPRLEESDCDFDLIINTIPTPIFTYPLLKHTKAPLLLELASPPGGFDPDAVHALGLRLISAPGLPGKVAPVTAARIIQKTIYHMLEELDL